MGGTQQLQQMQRTQQTIKAEIAHVMDAANQDAAFREQMLKEMHRAAAATVPSGREVPQDLMLYVVDGSGYQVSMRP